MKEEKTKWLIFASFIVFVFSLIYIWQGIYLPKEPNYSGKILFLVNKGEGLKQIANNLKKEGLIKSALLFRIYAAGRNSAGRLQAGTYKLSPSMNFPEILRKFVSGESEKIKITIPEGYTKDQIVELFSKNGVDTEDLLKLKIGDFQEEFDFLKDAPKNVSLEGFLFPDTYFFELNPSEKEIAETLLKNFDRKLTFNLREAIRSQKKTIFEVVVMASLVEKEVKSFKDKKLVSGILWKRLENSIPLQVDATITFLTGKKTTKISKKETQIDSPFNTYKYKGLPPTPICNPGLESIEAAVYPKDSGYWYYLSTADGKTIFSKTLKDHNIAKEGLKK